MKTVITMSLLLSSLAAFASGGHFHPVKVTTCPASECTSEQIKAAVPKAIEALAKWEKINPSWASAEIESVSKEKFKKGFEWVVTLIDRNIKDAAKQKRYIFITLKGSVVASNDTGK